MPEPRPPRTPAFSRAELPAEFTPETVRNLPIATLRRLADHRSGVLDHDEQQAFDTAMREVMRESAERVSQQLSRADWSAVRREDRTRNARNAQNRRSTSRADKQLERIARRIGQQVDLAETLAPGVDWSFAQTDPAAVDTPPPSPVEAGTPPATDTDGETTTDSDTDADEQSGTVADLEQRIADQVELVEVMSEIAEVSRRTYALEQQRDLQSTRTVFFGLVVSVAVLVSGWAPLVSAHDWTERLWIVGLTLGTCVVAAGVYGLVRHWQGRADDDEPKPDVDDDA